MAEYIEREKLLELYVDGKYDTADYHVPVPVIIQNIKDIPAADVRPVVRGKWTKKNDDVCYWFECSVCGQRPPWNEWGTEWQSPFCPNCGADMREES